MEKCIYALEQALFFVKSNGNDAEIINYLELEIKKYKKDIMITINTLTDIYNKWGDKNNLQPLGSADEELIGRKNLTKEQKEWLEKFIEMWDNQQDIDYFIRGEKQ